VTLKGDSLIALVTEAKRKHVRGASHFIEHVFTMIGRHVDDDEWESSPSVACELAGKFGAWHEFLQYLHRHGRGARPPPGNDPNSHSKRTQMVFLKSLRRCDRKGDVELVLQVEKDLAKSQPARPQGITMPNSFINLPTPVPVGALGQVDPRTGMPIPLPPTHAQGSSVKPSQKELAAQFGLNESALEALKDPAVRAALDPQVLAALGPVLQTL
jgi:hypothetical protein